MNQSDCSDVLSITLQGAKCSNQNQGRCHVDCLTIKITYWAGGIAPSLCQQAEVQH